MSGLDEDGAGLCQWRGRLVSVAGVLPGERVFLSETRGRIDLLRVLDPSPHRVTPSCRHAGECGGCTWQHVAYAEQLRLKRERVQYLLDQSLGTRSATVAATLPTPPAPGHDAPTGFRHKVHFAFGVGHDGRPVMGHLRRATRHVVDVTECPAHAEAGNLLAREVKAAVTRAAVPCGAPPDGVVRHVVIRVGRASGECVATLVATRATPSLKQVSRDVLASQAPPTGWCLNLHPTPGPFLFGRETKHVAGRERVREDLLGLAFLVSPTAFFQTNVAAAELLLAHVLAQAGEPPTRVLDLYAGLGLFALPLARRGHRVIAVEENPAAVQDGLASARLNDIDAGACRFVRTKVEYALDRLARPDRAFDLVVLDPPRAGVHPRVLARLRDVVRARRLVYVSCEPEALARDLRDLAGSQAPYRLVSATPIDMFPHTPHVEVVAVLDRE